MRTPEQKQAFKELDALIVGARRLETAKTKYGRESFAFRKWMGKHPRAGLVTVDHVAHIVSLLKSAVK